MPWRVIKISCSKIYHHGMVKLHHILAAQNETLKIRIELIPKMGVTTLLHLNQNLSSKFAAVNSSG